jgi:exosortase
MRDLLQKVSSPVMVAVVCFAVWVLVLRMVTPFWIGLEQYSYGWLTIPLALCAAVLRWWTRPSPTPPSRIGVPVIIAAGIAMLPTWILLQPSPDWRMMNWALAGEAAAITFGMLLLAGGYSWAGHFAIPTFFLLTAIPWPIPIENVVIGRLSGWVAGVTVDALNLAGYAAVQRGNIIELRTGLLDIDHACSGIRSLQASMMAAVAFGELYRLSKSGRVGLLIVAGPIALGTNVARACFLGWKGSRDGIATVTGVHDSAGLVTMLFCFAGLWGCAIWFAARQPCRPIISRPFPGHSIPSLLPWSLVGWIAAVLCGTELWFRGGPKVGSPLWSIVAPTGSVSVAVNDSAREALGYDESHSARWNDAEGHWWLIYFFVWSPGPMRTRVIARLHRPSACLPAVGVKLIEAREPLEVQANGINLQFRCYTFEFNGMPLFVYHGIWQNRGKRLGRTMPFSDSLAVASWQAVLWRERNVGQQAAEIALFGCRNALEADSSLRQTLPRLIWKR